MPFCRLCGHGYEGQANYCPNCGKPIDALPPPGGTSASPHGEPLLDLKSHYFATGMPTWLAVHETFVEVTKVYGPFDCRKQRMHYDQIAQVSIRRRFPFSALVIESRGGDITIGEGLSRKDAEAARGLIEQRM